MEQSSTLILEGGALRGVYTSGVLDALMEHGIYIPNVVGVSAGSLNALSYLSHQPGRSQEINMKYVHDARYMGPSHLLKTFSFFNFDFIFNEVFHDLVPFDYAAFYQSKQSMWAVATDCRTGRPIFYHDKEMGDHFFNACRASSSMPLLCSMVKVGNDVCLDGGIACAIPLPEELPFESGKKVVVLTRHKGAKKARPGSAIEKMYRRRYKKYPELMEACLNQPEDYNRRLAEIEALEEAGEIFVLRPQSVVTVGHTERDLEKLHALYEQGYHETLEQMDALKAYLGIESSEKPQKMQLDVAGVCNPLGMPKAAKHAATMQVEHTEHYPDPDCTKLRQAIAEHYDILAKGVMVGAGSDDLLYRLVLATKPKRALLLEPTYEEYRRAFELVGCEVISYALKPEQQFRPNLEELLKQAEDVDAIVVCNPNNPTGQIISRENMMQLLGHCTERNIYCVVDESFMDLSGESEACSLKQDAMYNSKLIVLDSFAKTWAMPGLRVGFCVCSDTELLKKMAQWGQPFAVSRPAQAAAYEVLQDTEHLANTHALLQQERQWLQEQLQQLGLRVFESKTNFILVQGPAEFEPMLQTHGILVRNCCQMGGLDSSYCRIAVKSHRENEKLIARLQQILQEQE